jgi:hypothetical protein
MQTWIDPVQGPQGSEASEVVDSGRHHEGHGRRHSPDGVLQRQAVLAQGEVKSRALKRPTAVEAGALTDWLHRKEVG